MIERNCYTCGKFKGCNLRSVYRYDFEPCEKWEDLDMVTIKQEKKILKKERKEYIMRYSDLLSEAMHLFQFYPNTNGMDESEYFKVELAYIGKMTMVDKEW